MDFELTQLRNYRAIKFRERAEAYRTNQELLVAFFDKEIAKVNNRITEIQDNCKHNWVDMYMESGIECTRCGKVEM